MVHAGSCHCGKIAFDVEADITEVLDCNCSLCRRRGALLSFVPRDALTLKTQESDVGTCTFNKHAIQHHFCATCGIAPYGEGADPRSGGKMAAVNVRCLPDVDLDALKIRKVDGASF